LLAGGARDLPDRQQNLRQTIAWSYDLLEAPERAAFRALSVFAGGFTIVAAAALLGMDEEDPELLDMLGALIDQSLLRRTGSTEGEPRVAMLETIREFGIEQLKASGEESALRSAHADFYRKLVERNADRTSGMALLSSTDELEDEMANIHLALNWFIDRGEADGAVGIVLAMSNFWMMRGYLVEGSRLLERAIEFVDRVSPEMQVRMLRLSGWFMCEGGNTDEALVRVKRAVEMSESLENMEERVAANNNLGVIHFHRKEYADAAKAFSRALEVAPPGTAKRVGALNNLGVLARLEGDYDRSRHYLELSLEERTAWGHPDPEAATNLNLAAILLKLGDLPRARLLLNEWFSEPWRLNSIDLAANGAFGLAHLALVEGDSALAAQLLGWSDDQRSKLPQVDEDLEHDDRQIREELTRLLGAEEFERLKTSGLEITREMLVSHARKLTSGPVPPPRLPATTRHAPAGLDPLTAREIEVARLVAAGKSTREIADMLFISARTAQTHVTNILGKLDLDSRAALAAWVVRNDPDGI
jgi:DNA-binding CsgD family transcriptional regulator/Tfp pilus assembly protein PilF